MKIKIFSLISIFFLFYLNAFSQTKYGWFENFSKDTNGEKLYESNIQNRYLFLYNQNLTTDWFSNYIPIRGNGNKLILQIPKKYVIELDLTSISTYLNRYNILVDGWYLYDEPDIAVKSLRERIRDNLKIIYKYIKDSECNKNVYLTVSIESNVMSYIESADIFLFDEYPALEKYKEFDSLFQRRFVEKIELFSQICKTYNKQFGFIFQAFGLSHDGSSNLFGRRNPTYKEIEFMVYYSLYYNPAYIIAFSYHYSNIDILEKYEYLFNKMEGAVIGDHKKVGDMYIYSIKKDEKKYIYYINSTNRSIYFEGSSYDPYEVRQFEF